MYSKVKAKMKHLIIIGARGWGREVYAAAKMTKAYRNGEFDIKGFLDSKVDAFEGLRGSYPPILCAPEKYEIQESDVFFVAMGEPKWRKHYAELMEAKGAQFLTIICDDAFMNSTAQIGQGSIVMPGASLSDNVTIGNHVMIHRYCVLGHDVVVNDYASLYSFVFMGGGARLGKASSMYPKSMIIPHKSIGDEASVAAASVVMRNVADGMHVMGNPAKKIEF